MPIDLERAIAIASAAEFAAWLEAHGATEREVVVAIYKKTSGKQTVTLDDLLDEALCRGWIDTQGRRVDDERFAIRFTPRRPNSSWSERNRASARRLLAEGRMRPAGRAALPPDLTE